MVGSTAAAQLYPARLQHTFALANLADDDAVKTAIATNVAAQVYIGAALNGALVGVNWRLPRGVSITTSASGATYNTTDPITLTGTDWYGTALVEEITLTLAGGNEELVSLAGFMSITQINTPVQLGGGGQFEFGVRDLVLTQQSDRRRKVIIGRQIRHGSDGDILIGLEGDTFPADPTVIDSRRELVTGLEGEHHDAYIVRLYGVAITTSDPVTVYV